MATADEILDSLGLVLPAPFPPAADYVACRRSGGLVYISGHGPMRDGKGYDVILQAFIARNWPIPGAL